MLLLCSYANFFLCSLKAGEFHELNNFVSVIVPSGDLKQGRYSVDVCSMNDTWLKDCGHPEDHSVTKNSKEEKGSKISEDKNLCLFSLSFLFKWIIYWKNIYIH